MSIKGGMFVTINTMEGYRREVITCNNTLIRSCMDCTIRGNGNTLVGCSQCHLVGNANILHQCVQCKVEGTNNEAGLRNEKCEWIDSPTPTEDSGNVRRRWDMYCMVGQMSPVTCPLHYQNAMSYQRFVQLHDNWNIVLSAIKLTQNVEREKICNLLHICTQSTPNVQDENTTELPLSAKSENNTRSTQNARSVKKKKRSSAKRTRRLATIVE